VLSPFGGQVFHCGMTDAGVIERSEDLKEEADECQ
jgi:hypothetical protein